MQAKLKTAVCLKVEKTFNIYLSTGWKGRAPSALVESFQHTCSDIRHGLMERHWRGAPRERHGPQAPSLHPTDSSLSRPTAAPAEDAGTQEGRTKAYSCLDPQRAGLTWDKAPMPRGAVQRWNSESLTSARRLICQDTSVPRWLTLPFVMALTEMPHFSWQLYIPCYFQTHLVCPHCIGFLGLWYKCCHLGTRSPRSRCGGLLTLWGPCGGRFLRPPFWWLPGLGACSSRTHRSGSPSVFTQGSPHGPVSELSLLIRMPVIGLGSPSPGRTSS